MGHPGLSPVTTAPHSNPKTRSKFSMRMRLCCPSQDSRAPTNCKAHRMSSQGHPRDSTNCKAFPVHAVKGAIILSLYFFLIILFEVGVLPRTSRHHGSCPCAAHIDFAKLVETLHASLRQTHENRGPPGSCHPPHRWAALQPSKSAAASELAGPTGHRRCQGSLVAAGLRAARSCNHIQCSS